MELSPKQQTTELIKKSNKILIVGSKNPDGDTLGSILAFSSVLKSLKKEVVAVVSDDIAKRFLFLPEASTISKELEGSNDFIIQLDVKNKPVEKLSYNIKDGILNIIITPEKEAFKENELNFSKGSFDFDLVIVLDTPDVDSIDKIYDSSTNLFFEKPVINIDHHSGNEYFGRVNLVEVTATSTAEILVSIIESLGQGLLTEEVATNLLAGIIYDTGSFKKKNTTPKSLTVAAQLLAAKARQQEIIDNFYKTKPLTTLKLWGQIFSGLVFDEKTRFVWSKVSLNQFNESGLDLAEINEIINEALSNTPGADVILLLVETQKGKFSCKIKGQRGSDVLKLAELFGGTGVFHSANFEVSNVTDGEIEEKIIKRIKENLKSSLGIREENEGKTVFVPLQKLEKKEEIVEPKKEEIKLENRLNEDPDMEKKAVEDVKNLVEKELKNNDLTATPKRTEDPISKAIESLGKTIEETKQENKMTPIADILKDKKLARKIDNSVFYDEDSDFLNSDTEITHIDEDKPESNDDIRVWRG